MRHDFRTSIKAALGRYLTHINWPLLFTPLVSCEEKWQVFKDVIHSGLDTIMPAKPVKICTAEFKSLKSLIMKRQKVFCAYGPDSAQFKYFRNLLNWQRKICRGKYYESKIQHLKGENPERWWDETTARLTSKDSQYCLSKSKQIPSMPLSSNHSRSINYQLLLNRSSRVRLTWDLKGEWTAHAKNTECP